ncbi:Endonuclease/exonuclease/phosphatase [Penicillium cf. griseofulvum]|uniref:Endonuclease/exonuclease/phosphatase n=1 Tax=Penicillium cf. griseofulvum TaxID=2972120 RepID=A0A9W9JN63_9EURO|nr:Endonuclease/exonuclease/phosphatase [Penicillium cf. griseofulvum]
MSTKSQTSSSSPTEQKDHASEHAQEMKNPELDLLSLSRAVRARKADYTRRRSIRVKVGTWNVAGISGTEKDVGRWFVQGDGVCERFSGANYARDPKPQSPSNDDQQKSDGAEKGTFHYSPEKIDLYVLGLQEVVDISSPTEALRPYVDMAPSKRWKEAVQNALPQGYQSVSEVQLVGLLLLIYASPAIGASISYVSSTSVGTGLMGYMGNKGAVATRLVLGETTRLVFINCHLAAGSDKGSLERRNWDSSQIVQRAKFDPVWSETDESGESGEAIGNEDFTFWFGDLNYRLDDISGDDVRQVLARHTANEYDKERREKQSSSHFDDSPTDSGDSSPSSPPEEEETKVATDPVNDEEIDPHNDPASLQTTIFSLLPHDQLGLQRRKGAAFHKGWREGHITFLPTYKYDVGSVAMFDTSEKQRGPSWCDRILFRTRQDKLRHEKLDEEAEVARKKDEEMKASGLDKAVADDNVLFEYDPDADGADSEEYKSDEDQADDDAVTVASLDSSHDPIHLDHYVAYQGILSSDHKPLGAIFTLSFDAVNRELKAKVHQEVARELDKAENEARPDLTVVVDKYGDQKHSEKDPDAIEFGDIAFDVPAHRSLTIANTSGTAATFSFAERHDVDDETIAQTPSWLVMHVSKPGETAHDTGQAMTSSPGSHTLLPGEVANVDVTAYVRSIEHVRLLNIGKVKLEDILVLHVDGGRDHFVSVHGRWLPTCFGCSIDELTRMPEAGARSLIESETPHPSSTDGSAEIRMSAPRELFRLTEAISELLTERAVAEWSMTNGESEEHKAPWTMDLSGGAWPFQPDTWTLKDPQERAVLQTSVREALDTNKSLGSIFAPELSSLHRLEVLSETLLTFLNALQDGIVTAKVWQDMEQQIIMREKSKAPPRNWEETQAWVLEHLSYSPAHSVSFTFVTFMLARIANEVAPVTSAAPMVPLSRQGKREPKEPADKQPETPSSDQTQSPTPASASAFITSGSFRRKNRSTDTSTSTVPEPASQNPSVARRQAVEAALASIFSRVLISASAPLPSKEKERRISEERRRSIIEPFLKMVAVDDRGPSGGRS